MVKASVNVSVQAPQSNYHNRSQSFSLNYLPYIGVGILLIYYYLTKKNRFFSKTIEPQDPWQRKKETDKILELKVVSPFCIGTPVLLCTDSVDVEKSEIGKIIEILDFNRVLVDFTKPFIFKNVKNNHKIDPKKLASQVKTEAVIILNL